MVGTRGRIPGCAYLYSNSMSISSTGMIRFTGVFGSGGGGGAECSIAGQESQSFNNSIIIRQPEATTH